MGSGASRSGAKQCPRLIFLCRETVSVAKSRDKVPTVPLVTSIPPSVTRLDKDGVDVGAAYQEKCILSWEHAFFSPCSVHSLREKPPIGVPIASVDRDASHVTGRPHVYFADLLKVGLERARGGPFALANADLMFKPELGEVVARLRPGEMIFSRRIDIDRMEQVTGEVYHSGFDFFAMHSVDAESVGDAGLVFGAPWWDHYLPLAMHMRGCKMRLLQPSVFHLLHEERWSWHVWALLGGRFVAEISRSATDAVYGAGLKNALADSSFEVRRNTARSILKKITQAPDKGVQRALHRVSLLNVQFLDECARTNVPESGQGSILLP